MAIYNDLRRRDILIMCFDLLKSGFLVIRDVDGKIDFGPATSAWDVPWHYVVQKGTLNCLLWSKVMFNVVFKKAPVSLTDGKVWVPSGCQQCFKVVARPKTLKQLFATVELQKRLNWHAKCGIEHRAHVFGLYGAYWYSRGLEQGVECYKRVRAAVDDDPLLGADVDVILKRGCTEMEMMAGPSDKYELTGGQMMIEEDFPTSFSAKLARKDTGLVLEAANTEGLHLALAEAVAARFDQAIEAGHGEEDMAAIFEATKPDG